jgi:phage terminase small subunit
MGKRGPRRTPLSLKELHGTAEPVDRRRSPEPVAPGLLVEPPDYLNRGQRRRFAEVLEIAPRHLLRRCDATVVAGFVIAESLLAEATRARNAAEHGGLVELDSKGRVMVGNYVKVQIRSLACLKVYLDLLGFSPSSRANLTIDEAAGDDPEDDRWRTLVAGMERRKLNGSNGGSIQ